jgi:hypothetical protein
VVISAQNTDGNDVKERIEASTRDFSGRSDCAAVHARHALFSHAFFFFFFRFFFFFFFFFSIDANEVDLSDR